jgi:hypothetical protein
VSPRHTFLGCLPCAGEVAAAGQACRATVVRVLRWPAELGQAARAALAEAELDRARAMQAGCAGTVQLGQAWIRPSRI